MSYLSDVELEKSLEDFVQLALDHHTLQNSRSLKTFPEKSTNGENLVKVLPHEGLGFPKTCELITSDIVPYLSTTTPQYFGLVTGGLTPISQIADHYVTLHDQNVILHNPSESISTVIEDLSINLLLDLFDLNRQEWYGTITTGATGSNLMGLAAGRQILGENLFGKDVSLDGCESVSLSILSDLPHSSILKAASILGIGRKNVVEIRGLNEILVEEYLAKCKKEGRGVIVVLGFGEVNTGSFPSNSSRIAELCKQYDAHLHIDAAFGIFARCSVLTAELATGLELADTICADGHKWLNVPYDCGFFFYRRSHHKAIYKTFNSDAAYLNPPQNSDEFSIPHPMNNSLSNSRRFRGLTVYTSLICYGKKGISSIVENNCQFARKLHEWIADPNLGGQYFENLIDDCVLNIVLFCGKKSTKWYGKSGNLSLVEAINKTGRMYVTGTQFQGTFAIRVAVSNWRTEIAKDWEIVKEVLLELYSQNLDIIPLLKKSIEYFSSQYHLKPNEFAHGPVVVDYGHVEKFLSDLDFGARIKQYPIEVMNALGLAVSEVLENSVPDLVDKAVKRIIRIINLDVVTPLKDLKANLMGRLICIRGTVVRVSTVKPIVQKMSFICNSCRESQTLAFADGKFKQPTKCNNYGCKSKSFSPDRSPQNKTVTTDWQKIRVQEKLADDQVDSGRVPRIVECELTEDLVDLAGPGEVVCLTGIVKVISTEEGKSSKKSSQMYFLYIDAVSLVKASSTNLPDAKEPNESDVSFTKDFIHFSNKDLHAIRIIHDEGPNIFRVLVNSFCPAIFGHELVKAGLLLALFGGRRRDFDNEKKNVSIRSDPHVLVVGDPGLGKSQMLSAAVKIAPRGVYVCGNTATTSGLTVTVTKDPETGETALEAGALVLGDQGVCCIDEFDKMTEHQALLEAMEQQSISIAKAGLVCNLPARTTVLAAANPAGGHYNKAKSVSENLKMGSALLSRFDLVFILLDRPDEEMDMFLSDHIMKLHSGGLKRRMEDSDGKKWNRREDDDDDEDERPLSERLKLGVNEDLDPIPQPLLRKYVAYAKRYVQPRLTFEAAQLLQEFYLSLRTKYRSLDSTPITTRQLESMIRLSEARAKCELRETVVDSDVKDVIEIVKFSMWETYKDESGNIDFMRSQNGSGMSKKGEPKRFIAELNKRSVDTGSNRFSYDQLSTIAKEIRLNVENLQDLIDSLNNQGLYL
ncbi:DNA replication licensing factor mcm8 [Nowakowskiella sp. JEL0407]|nr:DNA replication licensing factor mcm8 [Nowakowskiella sp. JEL0407]